MVQFASYLRRMLCKTRLIFPRINGPNKRLTSRLDDFNRKIFELIRYEILTHDIILLERT